MFYVPGVNETLLLDQIYSGLPGKLPNKARICAPYLREFILEIGSAALSFSTHGAVRWEIHNAIFFEELDLRDGCRSGGGFLPALEFVNCEFNAGFCADGAKIERLVFRECIFTADETAAVVESSGSTPTHDAAAKVGSLPQEIADRPQVETEGDAIQQDTQLRTARTVSNRISLRNCRIATELSLEGLKPNKPDGLLVVDAFAAIIGTNVIVRNSTFRAPQGESSATRPAPSYALDLSTADLGSDFNLTPKVTLYGGLKMRDARIGGTLWANGLKVTDGEDDISRGAIKSQRNTPRKAFRLETTTIQGNLMLDSDETELRQTAETLRKKRTEQTPSDTPIEDKQAETVEEKLLAASTFWSTGEVWLLNSTVGGDLFLSPGKIAGGLTMSNLTVRGQIWVSQPDLNGMVDLNIEKKQTPTLLLVSGAVRLDNCNVGRDCNLRVLTDTIYIAGGAIGGNANFIGESTYFGGQGINVTGNIEIQLKKMIVCNLAGARVGGTLNVSEVEFKEFRPRPRAVLQSGELSCYPSFHLKEV